MIPPVNKSTTNRSALMASSSPGAWFERCKAAVKQDPKRSGLLTVLIAVLLGIWGKMLFSNHAPIDATASPIQAPVADNRNAVSSEDGQHRAGLSLADWARQPVGSLQRNLFSVPFDYYPEDPAHPPKSSTPVDNQAKSGLAQADQLKERQILIQNLRAQAADLTLEGTILGANPRAWINGVLVDLGQSVGKSGFRVTKIESRRIFIEREGVSIELSMK